MFTDADYADAASRLDVSVAAIKAVAEVEASGQTLWSIDSWERPPVRFEAHWFGKLTGYRFNASHPHLSCRSWTPSLAAKTREGAWRHLAEARALDDDAACQATSWGAFQIMGFHWQNLGYGAASEFVAAMDSGAGQLDVFVRFVQADPMLVDALQRRDWAAFAGRYNGPGQVEHYAGRMAEAYQRHGGQ